MSAKVLVPLKNTFPVSGDHHPGLRHVLGFWDGHIPGELVFWRHIGRKHGLEGVGLSLQQ